VLIKLLIYINSLLQLLQNMYDRFKEDVKEAMNDGALSQIWTKAARQDHDAHVEVKCSNTGESAGRCTPDQ
jgi:hypothetical protein